MAEIIFVGGPRKIGKRGIVEKACGMLRDKGTRVPVFDVNNFFREHADPKKSWADLENEFVKTMEKHDGPAIVVGRYVRVEGSLPQITFNTRLAKKLAPQVKKFVLLDIANREALLKRNAQKQRKHQANPADSGRFARSLFKWVKGKKRWVTLEDVSKVAKGEEKAAMWLARESNKELRVINAAGRDAAARKLYNVFKH